MKWLVVSIENKVPGGGDGRWLVIHHRVVWCRVHLQGHYSTRAETITIEVRVENSYNATTIYSSEP